MPEPVTHICASGEALILIGSSTSLYFCGCLKDGDNNESCPPGRPGQESDVVGASIIPYRLNLPVTRVKDVASGDSCCIILGEDEEGRAELLSSASTAKFGLHPRIVDDNSLVDCLTPGVVATNGFAPTSIVSMAVGASH